MFRPRLLSLALAATTLLACGSGAPPPEEPSLPLKRGPRVDFAYPTIDGKGDLSTASLAGRFSVIGFGATYDDPSLIQARHISDLVRSHVPRINGGFVFLEPPHHRVFVESFVSVAEPPFPVAMADELTIAGKGPFEGLHEVPTVVILDRDGHEVLRRVGITTRAALDAALRALEKGRSPD